ncbi:hypothetical protein FQZ97_1266990 [compost metagenome]
MPKSRTKSSTTAQVKKKNAAAAPAAAASCAALWLRRVADLRPYRMVTWTLSSTSSSAVPARLV